MFKQTKRVTMGDDILAQFIDLLSSGKYKPMEKLPPERKLCEILGVSRPVLREVIRALNYLGYLESVQGGGTYISEKFLNAPISAVKMCLALEKSKLMEIWELRYILEVESAGLAAERATTANMDAIRDAFFEYERAVAESDIGSRLVESTKAFHNAIAASVNNKTLMEFLESISDLLSLSREKTMQVKGSSERAVKYHRALMDAICSRDSEKAKQIMREHLLDVKQDIELYLAETDKSFENIGQ